MTNYLFWRTIITDSESPTGLAPICPEHPEDRDTVTDCCPEPHIELYLTEAAAHMVSALNDYSSKHYVETQDCKSPATPDGGPHCYHYLEGDDECHWCGKPKWMPRGGL